MPSFLSSFLQRHAHAVVIASVVSSALLPSSANAVAYYVGEVGARSIARGGANIVHPDDPSAAWLNPAAVTLASGLQLNVDLNFVLLSSAFTRDCGGVANGCAPLAPVSRSYKGHDGSAHNYEVSGTRSPPTDDGASRPAEPGQLGTLQTPSRFDGQTAIRNLAGPQPIPRLMLSWNSDTLGFDGIGVALYAFAPNNGDFAFDPEGPARYSLVDRDLLELYYGIAVGYRAGDIIAVGAGLQFVSAGLNQAARISGDQYGDEDPGYDIQVRVTAQRDFIPSGNFGVWSNPGKLLGIGNLEIAGSMQLGRKVSAPGTITIESIGERLQTEFFDPGLAAFEADDATATAEFSLPPFYRAGIRYGVDDLAGDGQKMIGFDVEADFVYEQWSTYDHVLLSTQGVTVDTSPGDGVPGDELPAVVQPKDWTDAWSARLGGTVALWNKQLELHLGGFYESNAIPNETYSVELVDGDKIGVGTGVSGKIAGVRVDVGYSHIFVFDRVVGQESIIFLPNSGASILVPGETRTRTAMGKYSAGFDMLNVALTFGFDEIFGFGKHASQT